MALVNKILNIFIFLLAAASLFFGYSLFQRRAELRQHSEMMADSVATVVKDLDVGSDTTVSNKLNRDALGWENFHQQMDPNSKSFDAFRTSVLKKFEQQANDVRTQRDVLAASLGEIAELFRLEDLPSVMFQSVNGHAEAVGVLKEGLEQIKARDDTLIASLEDTAAAIEVTLEKGALNDVETYEEPLRNFLDALNKRNQRMVNYLNTLSSIVDRVDHHEFEVNVALLRDENAYTEQLVALQNDYMAINGNLMEWQKIKLDLHATQMNLERTISELETANVNLAEMETQLSSAQEELAKVRMLIGGTQSTAEPGTDGGGPPKDLQGEVIDVNYDWNYIIINIGSDRRLPEGIEGTVGRDSEFICKVIVTRVLQNYAVADILPKMKIGTVVEGDRVIF